MRIWFLSSRLVWVGSAKKIKKGLRYEMAKPILASNRLFGELLDAEFEMPLWADAHSEHASSSSSSQTNMDSLITLSLCLSVFLSLSLSLSLSVPVHLSLHLFLFSLTLCLSSHPVLSFKYVGTFIISSSSAHLSEALCSRCSLSTKVRYRSAMSWSLSSNSSNNMLLLLLIRLHDIAAVMQQQLLASLCRNGA